MRSQPFLVLANILETQRDISRNDLAKNYGNSVLAYFEAGYVGGNDFIAELSWPAISAGLGVIGGIEAHVSGEKCIVFPESPATLCDHTTSIWYAAQQVQQASGLPTTAFCWASYDSAHFLRSKNLLQTELIAANGDLRNTARYKKMIRQKKEEVKKMVQNGSLNAHSGLLHLLTYFPCTEEQRATVQRAFVKRQVATLCEAIDAIG